MTKPIGKRVIILGAGVAGMSAAHELVARGFEVEVYEMHPIAGGKARSVYVASARGSRPLPGEHGFRFFPAFYKHVTRTMREIPARENGRLVKGKTVYDNLEHAAGVIFDSIGEEPFALPIGFPQFIRSIRGTGLLNFIKQWLSAISHAHDANGKTPDSETDGYGTFAERVWQVLTSCERRRTREYERLSWWDFTNAQEQRGDIYRRYLVQAMTRSLIAANAKDADAKIVGDIGVQVLAGLFRPDGGADRVLNGPTNEVWIDPWQRHLECQGVTFQFDTKVKRLKYNHHEQRIEGVTLVRVDRHGVEIGQPYEYGEPGDYYIAALPVEAMAALLDDNRNKPLRDADPQFANIRQIRHNSEWMCGLQFYFKAPLFEPYIRDKALAKGHVVFLDSQWALTAISQPQFWQNYDQRDWGDGTVADIVSVIISDWNTKGLNGKTAKECTQEEIEDEVLAQIANHLYDKREPDAVKKLRDKFADEPCLDPDLLRLLPGQHPNGDLWDNQARLFINKPNSWQLQPEATTKVANLFLAGDYVRTFTQLPTMEAANEAARHAVNGIIKAIVKEDEARVRQATMAAARPHASASAPPKPIWKLTSRSARRVDGERQDVPFCLVWALHEPWFFWFWRFYDQLRYRRGLPWRADPPWFIQPLQWGVIQYTRRFANARRPLSDLQQRPAARSRQYAVSSRQYADREIADRKAVVSER
jgi:uncharacterized protein with NAD-binding domain and iron-sulfur cluster